MGNVFQCCQTLSNYFTFKDTPAPGEAERSPLLSSDESECESPSLPEYLEDDVLTVSTGLTNPALEPEHFLFPDIILSSNPGGDVTLVEPMVCLLVSEEDEERGGDGVRADEPAGGEGQPRSYGGRERGYSEVETQTEAETQIGMEVQTQTETKAEVETQTEIPECNNDTVEREVHAEEIDVDEWKQTQAILKSQEIHSEINTKQKRQKKCKDSGSWSKMEEFAELKQPGKTERPREFEVTLTNQTLQTEHDTALPWSGQQDHSLLTREHEKDEKQNIEGACCSVMLAESKTRNEDGNTATTGVHKTTKCSNDGSQVVEEFDSECHVDLKQQDNGQAEDRIVSEKDDNDVHTERKASECGAGQTVGRPILNADQEADLQLVLKLEDEDGPEIKQMTMFLVDRLFLAAPQVKGEVCFCFLCRPRKL